MFCKLVRVGNDPEVRFITSGTAVMSVSMAYAYGMKGMDGKRPTQWIEGTFWGKQAEALQPYLKKGDQISVSLDDVHIEVFKKKDGTEGFKLVGRVAGFDFVANGKQAVSDNPATSKQAGNEFSDMSDDIPF